MNASIDSSRGYLLLRREGGLFGVASADVLGLSRRGGTYRVEVAERGLLADEVVGVVENLDVRPLGLLVRRYWPEASDGGAGGGAIGWAVHGGKPVVVVDSRRPPRALSAGGSEDAEGEMPDGE
jgi:hypothetical protein